MPPVKSPVKTRDAPSKTMMYEGVSMTDWEKLKCKIRKCSEYIKRMKDQGLVVSTRDQWAAMIKHIKEIASLERWEDDIIAVDGPPWNEDLKAETLVHRKMREEAAIIIQGCVDKTKHG